MIGLRGALPYPRIRTVAAKFHVGQILPDGAVVESVEFEDMGDFTVERMRDSSGGGSMEAIPRPGTPAANQQQIMQRLRDAIVNDASFLLDKAADDHEQIRALTRQVTALARVALGRYETASGT